MVANRKWNPKFGMGKCARTGISWEALAQLILGLFVCEKCGKQEMDMGQNADLYKIWFGKCMAKLLQPYEDDILLDLSTERYVIHLAHFRRRRSSRIFEDNRSSVDVQISYILHVQCGQQSYLHQFGPYRDQIGTCFLKNRYQIGTNIIVNRDHLRKNVPKFDVVPLQSAVAKIGGYLGLRNLSIEQIIQ